MLQLVVFDLDNCIWRPEMYQIQGPPILSNLQKMKDSANQKQPRKRRKSQQQKLFSPAATSFVLPKKANTNRKGMIVTDRNGIPITVFDGASYALSQINQWRNNNNNNNNNNGPIDIRTAVASCTDRPSYARQCLEWLVVGGQGGDGSATLASCFDHVEIRPGDKRQHFESLQRKTGIPYPNMAFFDDYMLNIENVRTLGVKCVHTPHGMSQEAWKEALDMFDLN